MHMPMEAEEIKGLKMNFSLSKNPLTLEIV